MLRSVQTPPREEEPARSIGPHCCSCLVKNLLHYEIFRRLGTNLARETNRQIISRAQPQINLRRQASLGVGVNTGYERLFEEEFGVKRQSGVNCAITNNCTFAGASGERSTYNSRIYAFGSVTLNKKLRLFAIARFLQNAFDFDFDFGAGSRFP